MVLNGHRVAYAYCRQTIYSILTAVVLSVSASAQALTPAPPTLLQLHAAFTHPSSSGFVLDAPQAYFISADGQHKLRLDAWPAWPPVDAGPSIALTDLKQLPSMLRLRWFSSEDNQFWSIRLPLPTNKLRHYIEKSLLDTASSGAKADDGRLKSVFNRLVVTVKLDGWVTVWLGNDEYELQLTDAAQARKVEPDWAEFIAHWPSAQRTMSRQQWLDMIEAQDNLPYYNLRFERNYEDNGEPAEGSDYEVYTKIAKGIMRYCGTTDQHGQTREFISVTESRSYYLTDDLDGCAIFKTLNADLPEEIAPWSLLKRR